VSGLSCSIDLLLSPEAPARARTLTRAVLQNWGVTSNDAVTGAALVISELVTNAVKHCPDDASATMCLDLTDGRLRLSVIDCSTALPALREPDDSGGRGLLLISQLADHWGAEPHPGGKRVYAELVAGT
jgi:anti-sigma regulatory factor (Ser/Thr protein kinase)